MDLKSAITPTRNGVVLVVTLSYDNPVEPGVAELPKTHIDGEKTERFFSKCKYAVFRYHNIAKEYFCTLCNQLAKHEYPKTCRRLVVVFSGHGSYGEILFTERETMLINEMVDMFKPADAKNPTLSHMMRLFFIDACRGRNKDFGYPCKSHNTTETVEIECPNDANMLVAYATTKRHVSFDGVWLTTLLEELENSHVDLSDAFVNVNKRMKTNKINGRYYQVGEYHSMLSEKIYFIREARLNKLDTVKEGLKGASKGGGTQIVGSMASGTAFQCAKEVPKRIVGQGAKTIVVQSTKVVAKQAVKQTAKVAIPVGIAIEGVCLAYEINSAHNKKKRGEISKEQYHDVIVEQTATSGGSTAGGIGGGVAGAAVGAVVGSVVPVVGTVIGGFVGGFIGGVIGGLGGTLVGKGTGKAINYARHS